MRFEAFYAVPTGKTSPNFIYLFGSGQFGFGRATATNPLLLQPSVIKGTVPDSSCPLAPSGCRSLYDSNVYIQTLPQSNRDVYRIGIGLDFVQLYQLIRNAVTGPATGSAATAGNAAAPAAK
jgi:hypothetical protein